MVVYSYRVSALPFFILAHFLFIAITTLVLVWLLNFREGLAFKSSNKQKIFNLHPFFMVIGLILIGGQAIIVFKGLSLRRRANKVIHLTLHLIALASGVLGIIAIFRFKDETGQPDMFTLHSWLGIITISLYGLQWLFAFFAYFFPRAEAPTRVMLLPWHAITGLVILALATCTAETGLVRRFNDSGLFRNQEAMIVNFIGLLIFLFAVSIVLVVVLPRYR